MICMFPKVPCQNFIPIVLRDIKSRKTLSDYCIYRWDFGEVRGLDKGIRKETLPLNLGVIKKRKRSDRHAYTCAPCLLPWDVLHMWKSPSKKTITKCDPLDFTSPEPVIKTNLLIFILSPVCSIVLSAIENRLAHIYQLKPSHTYTQNWKKI